MDAKSINFTNSFEVKKLIYGFLTDELRKEKMTEVGISNIKILSQSSKSVRFTFESIVDGFPIPSDGSLELEANLLKRIASIKS